MSTAIEPVTQSKILLQLIELNSRPLSHDVAEWIISLRLTHEQEERLHELLDRGNTGTLTPNERAELAEYCEVGMLLSLLHAKALGFVHGGVE